MPNRLEHEDSPYLQQHKNNPVDWYPWCDEAFERAKRENKAIFISIGYSSCHWCHVMEEKVFKNEACAKILNEHFISIKVDREERPDIDKHYQGVYMLLNRRAGGWPTSIFCTPNNKPFYAGTYIPPTTEGTNIQGIGFIELTNIIAEKVAQNDPKLFQNADEVESFIKHKEHPKEATKLSEDFIKNFMLQAKNNYEPKFGGFSVAPKFPHVSTLNTLLHIDRLYDDKAARAMLLDTLENMRRGGMYDLVDGGFCRYSVDEMWLVPHFEKMLYDNALLCELYTKVYLAYGNESHLHTAKECADFWFNYMCEDDLFYSASDADSEGEEGTYFTYGYEELFEALAKAGMSHVAKELELMSVTPDGNFEGKNIIRFENIPSPRFEEIRRVLQELRSKREYPFIDKKIQTSWSSMMIKALFTLGSVDGRYTARALKHLEKLIATMYIEGRLYHTTLIHKEPKIEAFLEDYAFLAQALIAAFQATQDELYLIQAQRIANMALEKFYKNGMWNFSIGEFEVKAETTDNTYVSSISIMIDVLLSLSTLLEDDKYRHFAFKTLEYNSYDLGRRPIYYPYMLTQMLRYLKGERVVKASASTLIDSACEIAKLSYPFVLTKASSEEKILICGSQSCFAACEKIDEIDDAIKNSF